MSAPRAHRGPLPAFLCLLALLGGVWHCNRDQRLPDRQLLAGRLEESRQNLARASIDKESRFVLRETNHRFPLTVPEGVSLTIGFGVVAEAWDSEVDEVDFSLSFQSAGGNRVLFQHRVKRPLNMAKNQWHDFTLPLTSLAGKRGSLTFEARAVGGVTPLEGKIVWTNPKISGGTTPEGPNIILISIDTLRADHLGCYGYERETSPNIDRMARQGVLFRNAIAPSSWTLPSHASLFTGLNPSRHGAVQFGFDTPLENEFETIAEILWDHGYETAAFVGGGFVSSTLGFAQGFDRYWDPGRPGLVLPRSFVENSGPVTQWISERTESKFFAFLHTYRVHMPYVPPPPYKSLFDPDYTGRFRDRFMPNDYRQTDEGRELDSETVRHIAALYDGEIRYVDKIIGELLDLLRTSRLSNNTCVVLTSDHGEEFGEHGDFLHDQPKLYEELIRVPLIFWCPSRFTGGHVVDEPVSLIDVMPTVLDIADVPTAAGIDGASLYPALDGHSLPRDGTTFSQVDGSLVGEDGSTMALRKQRYKFILSTIDGSEELFDLHKDPTEEQDLSRRRPELAQKLRTELEATLRANPPRQKPDATPVEPDPALLERLRALGYMP